MKNIGSGAALKHLNEKYRLRNDSERDNLAQFAENQ
jgi:hypothetical protein